MKQFNVRPICFSFVAAFSLAAVTMSSAIAEDRTQDRDQDRAQDRAQDRIYGSQLMTESERMEHREKMRSMKTEQEREAYRMEHHKKMQERAHVHGLTLPDGPPAIQPGSGGMGRGMGGGMGGGSGGRR